MLLYRSTEILIQAGMDSLGIDLPLPSTHMDSDLFRHLSDMTTDAILWVVRILAILSVLQFVFSLINERLRQSDVGSSPLDDPPLLRRTDRYEIAQAPPPRRG